MTEARICEANLVEQFRQTFPEMEKAYQQELLSWGDEAPGSSNILAFVFKPILEKELAKDELTDFLRRFGDLLERVCTSGDLQALNTIWLKFFKLLLSEPRSLKLLWPVLGPSTRANIADAAARWKMISRLPAAGWMSAIGNTLKPN